MATPAQKTGKQTSGEFEKQSLKVEPGPSQLAKTAQALSEQVPALASLAKILPKKEV